MKMNQGGDISTDKGVPRKEISTDKNELRRRGD